MSQDESKFDTMRLIQGAETSDLYSLESIMQEFSDAPKQENPSKQGKNHFSGLRRLNQRQPSGILLPIQTTQCFRLQTKRVTPSDVTPLSHLRF